MGERMHLPAQSTSSIKGGIMTVRIPAVSAGSYVSLYLDHRAVGCGWHRYLVLRLGPKWVRLISTENAEAFTIARKDFAPTPVDLKPTRLARRLRGIAQDYGLEKTDDVRQALGLLRTQSGSRRAS